MVEVRIREDSRNRLSSFLAQGHAGWADSGTDVVCAAVSTLLQAAWLGLKEHANIAVNASRRSGRLELRCPAQARDREDARAILATAALSLECIAAQYPEHVRIIKEQEPEGKTSSRA